MRNDEQVGAWIRRALPADFFAEEDGIAQTVANIAGPNLAQEIEHTSLNFSRRNVACTCWLITAIAQPTTLIANVIVLSLPNIAGRLVRGT